MSRSVFLVTVLALIAASPIRSKSAYAHAHAPSVVPERLVIPSIGLDEPTWAVGVDRRGEGIVPKHNVGWFEPSARPGQGDNIVMWGHVLRWRHSPQISAPFANLHLVPTGADIYIKVSSGKVFRYRVVEKLKVRPTRENARYIWPVGSERLTLVTCAGDNVIVEGELRKSHRLIVIAEPIPEPEPAPKPQPEVEAETTYCWTDEYGRKYCIK